MVTDGSGSGYTFKICIAFFFSSHRPLIGTAFAVISTYLTYALMPNRLKDAVLSGTILAVTELLLLVYVGYFRDFPNIISNFVILLCANLAGICTHYPREVAQRKAFLETRQCIEARLKIQRENQQQVPGQFATSEGTEEEASSEDPQSDEEAWNSP